MFYKLKFRSRFREYQIFSVQPQVYYNVFQFGLKFLVLSFNITYLIVIVILPYTHWLTSDLVECAEWSEATSGVTFAMLKVPVAAYFYHKCSGTVEIDSRQILTLFYRPYLWYVTLFPYRIQLLRWSNLLGQQIITLFGVFLQVNSQLLEAIQQKVELSQQLEQWQVDMEQLLEGQMRERLLYGEKRSAMRDSSSAMSVSSENSDTGSGNSRTTSRLFSFFQRNWNYRTNQSRLWFNFVPLMYPRSSVEF